MNAFNLLGTAIVLSAPLPKAPTEEPPPIVGVWRIDSMKFNGRDNPILTPFEWEFTKSGQWIVRTSGKQNPGERKYVTNEKLDTATIDLIGDNGERSCKAIFRVDSDVLMICVATENRDRPTAFDSPKGSLNFFYTFKRVKKE